MPVSNKVYVVDPTPNDYQALVHGAQDQSTRFEFVNSERNALRHDVKSRPDMWIIINVRLPDMSGMDLHDMLHSRDPGPGWSRCDGF